MFFLAQVISLISNPFVIAFPSAFALVYKETNNPSYSLHWAFYSLIFTSIVVVFVLFGIKEGFFSDIDVSKRKQRNKFFTFVIFVVILYFLLILFTNGPKVLLIALSGILMGVTISGIINTKIKASIHVAVFSTFIYALALLYGGIYVWGVLLIPIIAWSRVKVKRHSKHETIAGGLLGILVVTLIYILFKIQGISI